MKAKQLDLNAAESAFGVKLIANGIGTQALHDTVVAYQANRRAGTHSSLTKAEVNLSGKKPWRQKGTGNARAGYASSPVWTGGGVVFGPKPRDYSKTVSRKVKRLALKKALSEAAKSGRLTSATAPKVEGKAKELSSWLKDLGLCNNALVVTKEIEPKLVQASRNIDKLEVFDAAQINAEQVLNHKCIVVLEDAFEALAARLK
jgi:large subunit ribosomal protein L4